MTFASDNWTGACERVGEALAEASAGAAPAYAADAWTGRALDHLSAFFERDIAAFFVATGCAANGLALASLSRPAGVAFCHVDAHLVTDEAGAPAFFAHGQSIETVDGPGGRIDPLELSRALARYPKGVVHHGQPAVVSIANVNEMGLCYRPADVGEIAALARRRGLGVHMDGARFANALVHTGASPADLTWRSGVDVLSLGFTKTGAWCAEAVIFFDRARRADVAFRHKQAGQLLSKNRFAAAQFCALLDGNHVLDLARHANAAAARLADVLAASDEAALLHRPQSNEVFAHLSPAAARRLEAAGAGGLAWTPRSRHTPSPPQPGWTLHRFVTSFRTSDEEVMRAAAALAD